MTEYNRYSNTLRKKLSLEYMNTISQSTKKVIKKREYYKHHTIAENKLYPNGLILYVYMYIYFFIPELVASVRKGQELQKT